MANKMLIDASHPEETRVVVLRGNRVEEFDFEAANRKQLRGNIYLAKVTRVEPSLQAASWNMAATATASSPSRKFTRTITRSRSPTASRFLKKKRASIATRTMTTTRSAVRAAAAAATKSARVPSQRVGSRAGL